MFLILQFSGWELVQGELTLFSCFEYTYTLIAFFLRSSHDFSSSVEVKKVQHLFFFLPRLK